MSTAPADIEARLYGADTRPTRQAEIDRFIAAGLPPLGYTLARAQRGMLPCLPLSTLAPRPVRKAIPGTRARSAELHHATERLVPVMRHVRRDDGVLVMAGELPQVLIPFDRREALSLDQAAGISGRSAETIGRWCQTHDIGRRTMGRWAVSRVALAVLLDGDRAALRAYLNGDRQSERVQAYFMREHVSV